MNDASAKPVGPILSSTERVNTLSHFHRAEIARMAGWRDRLDRTTNWAITVVAAMLSVSLSTASAHHGVLLFAMLLILLLLWIEARRYRFFDFYRARVRQFERHYFAQIFSPQPDFASDWLLIVGEGLRAPKFLLSHRAALARRLRCPRACQGSGQAERPLRLGACAPIHLPRSAVEDLEARRCSTARRGSCQRS